MEVAAREVVCQGCRVLGQEVGAEVCGDVVDGEARLVVGVLDRLVDMEGVMEWGVELELVGTGDRQGGWRRSLQE